MELSITFIQIFFWGVYLLSPLLLLLCFVIVILGQVVGRIECWSKFDTLYWSFITALTVGYGDIRPLKKKSKTLSVFIALLGIMFTGIVVAITVQATTQTFKRYYDQRIIHSIEEKLK